MHSGDLQIIIGSMGNCLDTEIKADILGRLGANEEV